MKQRANKVIFGSVNANSLHHHAVSEALTKADEVSLNHPVTLSHKQESFEKRVGDITVVADFSEAA